MSLFVIIKPLPKCYICKLNNSNYCSNCTKKTYSKIITELNNIKKLNKKYYEQLDEILSKKNKILQIKKNISNLSKSKLNLSEKIENIQNSLQINQKYNFIKRIELEKRKSDITNAKKILLTYKFDPTKINDNYGKENCIFISEKIQEINNFYSINVDYSNKIGYIKNHAFPLEFNDFILTFWTKNEYKSTMIMLILFLKGILSILGSKINHSIGSFSFDILKQKIYFYYIQVCYLLNIKNYDNNSLKLIDSFHLFSSKKNNEELFSNNNLKNKIFMNLD